MRKTWILLLALACNLSLTTPSRAVTARVSTLSGHIWTLNPLHVAVNAVSFGHVCGEINGVVVAQDPDCGFNGPIPPTRSIGVSDAKGNTVNADSRIVDVTFRLKTYLAAADVKAVTLPTEAFAVFEDPLTFTNASGGPFDVTLGSFFMALELGGQGIGFSAASYHSDMSTNFTGMLYSLDLKFVDGKPLAVSISLGSFLTGVPGWDATSLENQFLAALGGNTVSSDYFLTDTFSLPDIPIHVDAGQTLIVSSDDVSTRLQHRYQRVELSFY